MIISEDGKTITMRAPDDWHVHFRQRMLMAFLVSIFLQYGWRRRMVAEPNLLAPDGPNTTGQLAVTHVKNILREAEKHPLGERFEPIAVMQITENTTREMVRYAYYVCGVRIFKVYPLYVTTNSENGVFNYRKIYPALAELEKISLERETYKEKKIVVQFHAEHPSYDVEGEFKEEKFLMEILSEIVKNFPGLQVTVEHVKGAFRVSWVLGQSEKVAAGVTIQHLTNTIDDLTGYSKRSGGKICPHEGFKPQAGKLRDQAAIREIVIIKKNNKFFYGGDPAWHLKKSKECAHSACGAANTLAAIPLTLDLFQELGRIEDAENFLSGFGADYYGYPRNTDTITIVNEEWKIDQELEVPGENDTVVPWRFGETMNRRVLV